MLSISGLVAGTLVQAEFFSSARSTGRRAHFHITLPVLIAIAFLLLVYFANANGIRGTVAFSYITGILLLIPWLRTDVPAATSPGDFKGSNMDWDIGANGGIALALTWLYFMGWSSYGFEACATSRPSTATRHATPPRRCARRPLFSVLVYALLPLGLGGTLGTQAVANDPTAIVFYKTAFDMLAGIVLRRGRSSSA